MKSFGKPHCFDGGINRAVGRENDHVDLRFQREEFWDHIESIFIAEAKIEKGRVETSLLHKRDGFCARARVDSYVDS